MIPIIIITLALILGLRWVIHGAGAHTNAPIPAESVQVDRPASP